jgi:hypothetical protein
MSSVIRVRTATAWSVAMVGLALLCDLGCAGSSEGSGSSGARTGGGGSHAYGELPEAPPESMPFMQLASSRCAVENPKRDGCTCRPLDGAGDSQREDKPVAAGAKRYEIRLHRTRNPSTVALSGLGRAHRSPDSPSEVCYYVDMGPGDHALTYHVKALSEGEGLTTGISVAEYNPGGGWWYPVFEQRCGGGGVGCGKDDLTQWRQSFVRGSGGMLDICGSTRVTKVRYQGMPSPANRDVYSDVTVQFVLRTYRFITKYPPRSNQCKRFREAQ